ncbi:hypothetical protein MMPV_004493 [Pyropia vietnamensis]
MGAKGKLLTAVYIALWFMANGATILGNKFIFHRGFTLPLTLTLVHMSAQSVLAALTIEVFRAVDRVPVSRADFFRKVLPISVVFCANIVLGNVSLRFLPVSFMQTVKSLTPVATALLQYIVFRSRLTSQALLTLIPVTGGVAIATITELSFHAGGFIAALTSCFLTGLKFVLSASVLGGSIKLDSINLLLYMAPPAVIMLFPVAVLVEGGRLSSWMADPARLPIDYGYILLSAVVSFALNVMLFVVLKATSSVTVTVAGNLKTVVVIALSVAIFRNPFTVFNAVGCLVAIGGCMWYGLLPKKWATMGTLEEAPPPPPRTVTPVAEVVEHKAVRRDPSADALLGSATEAGLSRANSGDGIPGMVAAASPAR